MRGYVKGCELRKSWRGGEYDQSRTHGKGASDEKKEKKKMGKEEEEKNKNKKHQMKQNSTNIGKTKMSPEGMEGYFDYF